MLRRLAMFHVSLLSRLCVLSKRFVVAITLLRLLYLWYIPGFVRIPISRTTCARWVHIAVVGLAEHPGVQLQVI